PHPVVRLAVAATGKFGADVLAELAARRPIEYVLTRPDRPKGRGRQPAPPPAKKMAKLLEIPARQPERPAGLDLGVDLVVLVDYGALIPTELLEQAQWLNVHPSLLPRWRGAAPVERAIMAGDAETGVSVIRLVEELDAGPVGAVAAFPIEPDDDAGAVYGRAADLAPDLVEEALAAEFRPQEGDVSYAEKIGPEDRLLDWSLPPEELHDRIRALSPHIGARGELHGRPVIVWRSRLDDDRLEILEVQPEGGRRMTLDEFERGLR
ncbi:MAG TPA: methionyl-tRNA formyltransferase, partial [Gaiellaceae bacterium]|nr:methionyl-tRNA formyltransferase [Gaiellaceae bacterium]